MAKVVVFGGAGFLGSHVCDVLSDRGYEVTIFDIIKSEYLREDQKMIVNDILDDQAVIDAIKGADYVYHFAAIADIDAAKKDPVSTAKFNILGTVNILEACRIHNVKRFIFSSTIYVYSNQGSFYRCSKQACELFIENYQKEYDIPFTILRYGSLYGHRANDFNFIKNSIKEAIENGTITRKGDGSETREYINVLDASTSSVDIMEDSDYENKHLIITGTQSHKVSEVLEMIKEILQNSVEIIYDNEHIAEDHYQITPYTFKPTVALKIIPKDFHDLGQGILECIYDQYSDTNNIHGKSE